jgi:hypothetical protein
MAIGDHRNVCQAIHIELIKRKLKYINLLLIICTLRCTLAVEQREEADDLPDRNYTDSS